MILSRLFCLIATTLVATVSASSGSLIKSSALLTCMDNSEFTASTFDVMFFPGNKSVTIEISAISNIDSNITAQIEVIAYGITVVTEKVNPCSYTALKSFCPMSSGHLDLSTNLEISSDIVNRIPGIAYTIPDLDGQVRVTVFNEGTTTAIACVEATLSNGKTVQTKWASWGMGIVCLIGILTAGSAAIGGYTSTSAHIASNVVSLFTYFQGVAITSMMAVYRLPPIAAAWAQNFQWTMGIMRVGFMQSIFSWYVQSTGGTALNILPNKASLSVEVQKRALAELSPSADWSDIKNFGSSVTRSLSSQDKRNARRELYRRMVEVPKLLNPPRLFARASNSSNSEYVTTNEADPNIRSKTLMLRGMQRVAYLADVELSNMFLTGLTFFCVLALFSILFMVLVKVSLELLAKGGVIHSTRCSDFRSGWKSYCKGFLFRLTLIAFSQLSVLCLYELTRHDSAATVVLAIVSYLTVLAVLGFAAYKVISIARKSTAIYKNPAYILYSDPDCLNRWGFLYVNFRATAHYFLIAVFAYAFLKACFVALIQAQGKAQAMGVFIIELAYLAYLSYMKPYMDKPTNGFNIGISAVNFINSIFFLFFSKIFNQPESVSSVAAVVFFVLNAVFSLVLLLLIVASILWFIFARNPDNRYQPMRDDRDAFMKDASGEKKSTELDALGVTAAGDTDQTEQFRRSMMQADDEDDTIAAPQTAQYLRPTGGGYQNLERSPHSSSEFPRTHLAREEGYGHDPFGNEYSVDGSSASTINNPYAQSYGNGFTAPASTSYHGYRPETDYSTSYDHTHQARQPPQW